jgi:hypothetical protein
VLCLLRRPGDSHGRRNGENNKMTRAALNTDALDVSADVKEQLDKASIPDDVKSVLEAADYAAIRALLRLAPGTIVSHAIPTINTDLYDTFEITAQAEDITNMSTNLSGTPVQNQTLLIVITGTAARAINWGGSYEGDLPATTITTQTMDILLRWNVLTSKWRCLVWASA